MGLLDFIFGKAPEWEEVSKDTFSTEDTYIYSKGESKQLFKLYLGKLGFSKEDIRDEVELYTESMQDDEESIKESDGWKPYLIKWINDRVETLTYPHLVKRYRVTHCDRDGIALNAIRPFTPNQRP